MNRKTIGMIAGILGLAVAAGTAAAAQDGKKEIVLASFRDGAMEKIDAATYNGPIFLFKMMYESFVEDAGDGTLRPMLAVGWDISPDGRTYTWHLRKGVKFSDGTDFNADAVIFNLKRWTNNGAYGQLTSSHVESMKALDDYTVQIVYEKPSYTILMEQSYPRPNRFLSPASIKDDGSSNGKFTRPVGTGPWMLKSYEKDLQFTLVPNPYYWGEKPRIDSICFKVIPDAQSRVMALKSGEVDIIGGDSVGKISMESLNELKSGSQFKVFTKGTMCSHFIAFYERSPFFQDKRVRLALNYAVDKAAIAQDLFDNNGLEAHGMFQDSVPYVNSHNSYAYPYDPDKANKILEEAGYVDSDGDGVREKDGKKMEFRFVFSVDEFPEWKSLAEFLQAQFAQVGVKVNLVSLDKNGYVHATWTSRNFDMALMRTASDSWVPHNSLIDRFLDSAGRGYGLVWTDEKLNSMISNVMLIMDEKARQAMYDQIFSYICDEALTIPVYYPVTSFAVNTEKIKDFEIGVNSYAPVDWDKIDVKK